MNTLLETKLRNARSSFSHTAYAYPVLRSSEPDGLLQYGLRVTVFLKTLQQDASELLGTILAILRKEIVVEWLTLPRREQGEALLVIHSLVEQMTGVPRDAASSTDPDQILANALDVVWDNGRKLELYQQILLAVSKGK
jgi:hypothetical protein